MIYHTHSRRHQVYTLSVYNFARTVSNNNQGSSDSGIFLSITLSKQLERLPFILHYAIIAVGTYQRNSSNLPVGRNQSRRSSELFKESDDSPSILFAHTIRISVSMNRTFQDYFVDQRIFNRS